MIASTVDPNRAAMPQMVSPATTWYDNGSTGLTGVEAGRGIVAVGRVFGAVGAGVVVTTEIGVPTD
jgi:hypothetical protein